MFGGRKRGTLEARRIASEIAFAALLIYVPTLQKVFGTAALGPGETAFLLPFPLIVWGADELRRWFLRRRRFRARGDP